MDSTGDSASVGLNTSCTSAIQCLSATWTGSHFPGLSVDKEKQTGLINNVVDNGDGLRSMGNAARSR